MSNQKLSITPAVEQSIICDENVHLMSPMRRKVCVDPDTPLNSLNWLASPWSKHRLPNLPNFDFTLSTTPNSTQHCSEAMDSQTREKPTLTPMVSVTSVVVGDNDPSVNITRELDSPTAQRFAQDQRSLLSSALDIEWEALHCWDLTLRFMPPVSNETTNQAQIVEVSLHPNVLSPVTQQGTKNEKTSNGDDDLSEEQCGGDGKDTDKTIFPCITLGSTDVKRKPGRRKSPKIHTCHVCHRDFSRLSNMNAHMRIHTGECPFVCDCGRAFKQKSNLKRHFRVHNHNKPKKKRQKRAKVEIVAD